MTTIVDLNTGQVLGIVDGRDSRGVGTNRLWRTVNRWWKEIEVLIVTGATTAKVEANNTAIKHIKRTGRGFVNSWNYSTRVMLRSAAKTTAC
uniref:transposase n=1 Tax=Arthrobacter mobilis TaxID=2724944 RepID=UPI001FE362B4|nr:transposase [Arthrobacter mobilis]